MDTYTKRWMNIDDVAAYLGFSASKIYKLVGKHAIPYVHVDGKKTLRFDVKKIDEWMEKQAVKPIKREIEYPQYSQTVQ